MASIAHHEAHASTGAAPGPGGEGGAPAASSRLMLDRLPRCVLEHLLTTACGIDDQARWMAVCSSLNAAARSALSRRTSWSAASTAAWSDDEGPQILVFIARHCPNLQHLSLAPPPSAAAGAAPAPPTAGDAPGGMGPALLRLLAASPHLCSASLLDVGAGDEALALLAARCGGLRHLAIGRTDHGAAAGGDDASPTDAGLGALARGAPHLRTLSLLRCASITGVGLAALSRAAAARGRPLLRALALRGCGGVGDAGLAAFLRDAGGRLQTLEVAADDEAPGGGGGGGAAFGPEACAAAAAHCRALQTLRVSEERLRGSCLDDGALCALARSLGRNLVALELTSVDAGDAFLAALADACPSLRALSLDRTRASNDGAKAAAAACPELRDLRFAGGGPHAWLLPSEMAPPVLTESGLRAISDHCRHLTALEVAGLSPDPEPPGERRASDDAAASDAHPDLGGREPDLGDYDSDCDAGGYGGGYHELGASSGAGSGYGADQAGPVAAPAPAAPLLSADLCRGLSRLCLDWIKAEPAGVQAPLAAALAACRGLRRLSLEGYQGAMEELLSALASAGAPLQSARLAHTQSGDAALALLAGAFGQTLTEARLAYCRRVQREGVRALAALPRLETLDLYQVPSAPADAIADLARSAPALSTLYLGHHTASCCRPARALSWGGARAAGAADHLAPVLAAAAARRGAGSGLPPLRVLFRDPSGDESDEARAAARAAAPGH